MEERPNGVWQNARFAAFLGEEDAVLLARELVVVAALVKPDDGPRARRRENLHGKNGKPE